MFLLSGLFATEHMYSLGVLCIVRLGIKVYNGDIHEAVSGRPVAEAEKKIGLVLLAYVPILVR